MRKSKDNGRAGVERVVVAFLEGRKAKEGRRPDYKAGNRYATDGVKLLQWGNLVAEKIGPGQIRITDAGWKSVTTKALLNEILARTGSHAHITQTGYQWYIGGKPWRGEAVISLDGGSVQANRTSRQRRKTRERRHRKYFVSLYRVGRDYGGPEEGGWWYDVGEPLKWQAFATRTQAEKFRAKYDAEAAAWKKRHSWPGDDKLRVFIGREHPRPYPQYRPRYENNKGRRNPLTVSESKFLLHRAARSYGRARSGRFSKERSAYLLGRASGRIGVVGTMGPKRVEKMAGRMEERVRAMEKAIPNPLRRVLKNLHTARERAYAKKLIRRYWESGKAAIVSGSRDKAAHAYGALAAIRRIAQFELPHAKAVSTLATIRMEMLRQSARDMARYRAKR